MDVSSVDPRKQRGAALVQAKGTRIKQIVDGKWFVPSQSATSGYVVDVSGGTCSCPDFEDRGVRCKHQWAVLIFRHEVTLPDGTQVVTEAVRITYPQRWPEYNRAQTTEKETVRILLRSLCDGIVQPEQTFGRPRLLLRDVVYAGTMKVYTTFSGRRATSDIRACEQAGLVEKMPAYNSVFRYLEKPELTPLLKTLVDMSAKPLRPVETTFAIDGTGFSTNVYARWFDHRYGKEKKGNRKWVKLHASVGTLTNIVTAAEITESDVNDATQFVGLVERNVNNGFKGDYSADKAYLSHNNMAVVEKHGGTLYVPFKSNSLPTGSAAWERLYHLFSVEKEEFLRHYHQRSNVESTFSMMKRKFGHGVRSKVFTAQANEVLLKCICHNLSVVVHSIHELGIEPRFWMPTEKGQ